MPSSSDSSSIAQEAVSVLDLKRQYASIKDEVAAAIERVLTSQQFIGGPELEGLERESAEYLAVNESVGCASGTDALWLALQASGVGPGNSVITSAVSFFASVSSITRCAATPVIADVDPATLNLDPSSVEKLLKRARSNKVRAVMPVHLYGQCADMDAFRALALEHDLEVLEDAAQAFGASWGGRKAGALGDVAAFSFYPSKNLSAYGDAGCVTTNHADLAERIRRLRNHGSRRRYYHEEIGWNSRLDAIQAAVLRVKLQHVDEWNRRRRNIAGRYGELFSSAGLICSGAQSVNGQAPIALLATRPAAYHIYHQYVVRALRRDELRGFLTHHGIGTEIYYPVPLHLQPCFSHLGYRRGDLPEAERAAKEVLALPMFPELREDEQLRVVARIAEFYSQ